MNVHYEDYHFIKKFSNMSELYESTELDSFLKKNYDNIEEYEYIVSHEGVSIYISFKTKETAMLFKLYFL